MSTISQLGENTPFNFWSTLITTGQEIFGQQLALPWSRADKNLKYRVKDGGTWEDWQTLVTNSDFVPQVFHVTTVANKSTEIVNSPTTPNYLPIITSVSNSTSHQTTITYNGGKWYIYSNYSQTVQIHFYKIPN